MPVPNPMMIALAREARGHTQTSLSQELGLAQGTLSKVENRQLEASPDLIEKLASALGFPASFFYRDHEFRHLPLAFFRKKASLNSGDIKAIRAKANVILSQVRTLISAVEYPPLVVPRLNLNEFRGSVEGAAQALRMRWHVPPGPINNMTKILEEAGIIVIHCDLGLKEFDGLSLYEVRDELPPLILVNRGVPGDRLRFTLAHELAHIVLHHHLPMPPEDSEAQAHQFAGAFLMPRDEIRGYLTRLTLPTLASLKTHWKVAMQAIVMRAYQVGQITEKQKYYLFSQISQRGFRLKEPIEIAIEEPSLIRELIEFHLQDLGYSREELSNALGILEAEFASLYLKERAGLRLLRR